MDRSKGPESMGAYIGIETFLSYLTFMRELRRRWGGRVVWRRRNMSVLTAGYTLFDYKKLSEMTVPHFTNMTYYMITKKKLETTC